MARETIFKSMVAVLGAAASFLFGGGSHLLQVLVLFVVLDYVSGLLAAGFAGEINSDVGFRGIARKIFIFLIVALAHQIDLMKGGENRIIFDLSLLFYIVNEMISIIENASKVGIPIPEVIVNAVHALQNKAKERK